MFGGKDNVFALFFKLAVLLFKAQFFGALCGKILVKLLGFIGFVGRGSVGFKLLYFGFYAVKLFFCLFAVRNRAVVERKIACGFVEKIYCLVG